MGQYDKLEYDYSAERLQHVGLQDLNWERNDSNDDFRDDVTDAIAQLQGDTDFDAAADNYSSTVIRSHGKPAEALQQTDDFIERARTNPIVEAQNLVDHYKTMPPGGLYQPPPVKPDFSNWHDEDITRYSIAEVKAKARQQELKAQAAPQFQEFKDKYGNTAATMLNGMVNIHREMSANPDGTGARLPVTIIQDTIARAEEAAGLDNAEKQIEAWGEESDEQAALLRNPRLRREAKRKLDSGEANTLEEAFGLDSRNDVEITKAAWDAAVAKMSPKARKEYEEHQARHRKATGW